MVTDELPFEQTKPGVKPVMSRLKVATAPDHCERVTEADVPAVPIADTILSSAYTLALFVPVELVDDSLSMAVKEFEGVPIV